MLNVSSASAYYSRSDIRNTLMAYIATEDLVSENPKAITLDMLLVRLLSKDELHSTLTREELLQRLQKACTLYYRLESNGDVAMK